VLFQFFENKSITFYKFLHSGTGWTIGIRITTVHGLLFASPLPDWIWRSSSVPSNGYRGFFTRRWSGRSVMLTPYLVVPRLKCVDLYFT